MIKSETFLMKGAVGFLINGGGGPLLKKRLVQIVSYYNRVLSHLSTKAFEHLLLRMKHYIFIIGYPFVHCESKIVVKATSRDSCVIDWCILY